MFEAFTVVLFTIGISTVIGGFFESSKPAVILGLVVTIVIYIISFLNS